MAEIRIDTNNRFYQNRKRIDEICKAERVDYGVANRMLLKEKGWTSGYLKELIDWEEYLIKMWRKNKLADAFK